VSALFLVKGVGKKGYAEKNRLSGYTFGFNGMEKDDEVHNVSGSSYDFGARMLNTRLGRWMAVDPLAGKYPSLSPYSFVGNMPIKAIDPDGREIVIIGDDAYRTSVLKALVKLANSSEEGKRIYQQLVATNHKIVIYHDPNSTEGNVNHGYSVLGDGTQVHEIDFNPNDISSFEKGSAHADKEIARDESVSIYHELRHAEQNILASGDKAYGAQLNVEGVFNNDDKPIAMEEVDAVFGENMVRSDLGMDKRHLYDGTRVIGVNGVRLMNYDEYEVGFGHPYKFTLGDYSWTCYI
jgi:RHS repeat-associated protein